LPIISINKITDAALDRYDVLDQVLIPSQSFLRNFDPSTDYVECHVYTQDDILLASDYNVKEYTLPQSNGNKTNQIVFDPGTYLTSRGYNVGDFKLDYRIYRKQLFTLAEPTFFITEISTNRTEIRLSTNIVSNLTIETNVLNFINQVQASPYFKDFILNFGDNKAVNAINIALDKSTNPYSLLIKLYQPLPTEFKLKSALWVVEELASPIIFEVVVTPDFKAPEVPMLARANFDIDIHEHAALASPYVNQSTIFSTPTISNYQNIINQLNDNSISINVDYSDYNNFVHFSSAAQRLINFVYKLTEIENKGLYINNLNSIPNMDVSVSGSSQAIQASINSVIQNFDPYESFLYNSPSPYAWPKVNSVVCSVTSSQAISWLGDNTTYGQLYTASLYDLENLNNLAYSIPQYLAEDEKNADYLTFTNMLGQHYDSIWIYIKAINDIHKADNNLNTGVSKDMVYNVLKSYGIKLYNNNSGLNLEDYLIGNPSTIYTITGSSSVTSGEDRTKELYKRIYHNLPYLLKSKGTIRGLQNLITVYGIPDTILSPIQYGGADNTSSVPDYVYDRFAYSLQNNTGSYVQAVWGPLTQNYIKYGKENLVPNAIEFRIKPQKDTKPSNVSLIQCYSSGSSTVDFGVTLDYTSSASIPYGLFTLRMRGNSGGGTAYYSSSLSVPMYATGSDGETGFWNLRLTTIRGSIVRPLPYNSSEQFVLTVQNCISGRIGHTATATIDNANHNSSVLLNSWVNTGTITTPRYLTIGGPGLKNSIFSSSFIGSIQDLRLWSEPLYDIPFNVHTLNNESIQGNTIDGGYNDLAARFPLGNNLFTYNHYYTQSVTSVNPEYRLPDASGSYYLQTLSSSYSYVHYGTSSYGSVPISQSYLYTCSYNTLNFIGYPNQNNYTHEYELVYTNIPQAGYYSPVTEKVRVFDNTPDSNVLSPYLRIEPEDTYRTRDIHFTEVSFSPQNELNKDIIAQYGDLADLDQYIGDPTYQGLSFYPDVKLLNEAYHQKFLSKYDYKDFVGLVSQIDNTLFKMIADFTPARTNLSTGVTIKSTILERNKVPRYQPSMSVVQYTASLGGYTIDAGSSFSQFNKEIEFITGDISGSFVDIHDNYEARNLNKYLLYSSSLNLNSFKHSDFNVTNNDVYDNRLSNIYKKEDVNNPHLLEPIQLQDSEYNHSRWFIPRYVGSKVSVQKLNVYTKGDLGYGTTPSINRYAGKLGYVLQGGANNLNFYFKTTFNMKYLVDPSGSLTTLTSANLNLFEVQNTFKSGRQITIDISDIHNPSNQKKLSGIKNIWKGGFSYDPILYRENNQQLDFTFDEPISSYVSYFGVKAHDSNVYNYFSSNDDYEWPSMPPTNLPGTGDHPYRWYINWQNSQATPISNLVWSNNNWKYADSGISQIDLTVPISNLDNLVSNPFVYSFNLLNFNTIDSNTENAGVYDKEYNNNYIYKVPRAGSYYVRGQIPIYFSISDEINKHHAHYHFGGNRTFKFFGLIEKCVSGQDPTNEANWVLVSNKAYTRIGTISDDPAIFYRSTNFITPDNQYNSFSYDDVTQFYTKFIVDPITVDLELGDLVRFQFYMVDSTSIFGTNGPSSRYFNFHVNSNSDSEATNTIAETQKAFFQIYDVSSPYQIDIYTASYNQYPPLFTVNNNTLSFDATAQSFFYSSSFTPTSPTSEDYTPVLDNLSIQPFDLIRIGGFKQKLAQYYTVVTASVVPVAPFTINGGFFAPIYQTDPPQSFSYPITGYHSPDAYFKVGNTLSFTSTDPYVNKAGSITVYKTERIGNYYYIYFNNDLLKTSTIGNPPYILTVPESYPTTFTPSGQTIVTLDRPISVSNGLVADQNFAILRPKPDETSVIVDFKKNDGEVSATLLIPENANADLINAEGSIFTTLNPSLK